MLSLPTLVGSYSSAKLVVGIMNSLHHLWFESHLRNIATYSIMRPMLGHTNGQQLDY